MPALRGIPVMASRSRRRSSVFSAPTRAGVYGVNPSAHSHLTPRPISFAPNVTPVTFNESSDSSSPSTPEPLSPGSQPRLFPPSETPAPPPARKRCPPGKRRSQGYIPRPPNAFMLFRADFVRQKHVPGSIETNHGSLSKIIGNCWRSLPIEEKRVWEQRAKQEKAAHKIAYPHYRFRPVHNKNKKKAADSSTSNANSNQNNSTTRGDQGQSAFEEEIRCEEVTQLLLEGKKGEELAQALRDLEKRRELTIDNSHSHHSFYRGESEAPSTASTSGGALYAPMPTSIVSAPQPSYPSTLWGQGGQQPMYMHRRSSSVPLPLHHQQHQAQMAFEWSGEYNMDFGASSSSNAYLDPMSAASQPQDGHGQQGGISIPQVPFLPPPSSGGIDGGLSKSQRMMYGHRRSSSAGAAFGGIQRGWTGMGYAQTQDAFVNFNGGMGMGAGVENVGNTFDWGLALSGEDVELQRDDSALPEADLSLFNPSFGLGPSPSSNNNANSTHNPSASIGELDPLCGASPVASDVTAVDGQQQQTGSTTTPNGCFNVADLYNGLPPPGQQLGPLDTTGLSSTSGPESWVNQPTQDGLGLDFTNAGQAGQYDQGMYISEADQAAGAYGMGTGYDIGAGYDMSAYVNVNSYDQSGQYVSC